MVLKYNQQDFAEIPVKNFVAEQLGSDPGSPANGRVWYNTAVSKIKARLNGVTRILVDDGDSRLSDSRPPNGAAGGSLTGSYPNPTLGNGVVALAQVAASLIQSGLSGGSASTAAAALRALGFTANDAMPGNARLDQVAAPTAAVSMNGQRITNQADPISAQDSATKAYVDGVAQGLDAKASVRYMYTGANFDPATSAPSQVGSNPAFTPSVGDRIAVNINQSAHARNGIYVVQTVGTGSNGVWVRAADMDNWSEVKGAFVFVEGGDMSTTGWVAQGINAGTIGVDAISWNQFAGAGEYIDGAGLVKTGNTFDVNVDGSTLEIASDAVRVKDGGIVAAKLADGSVDLNGTKTTGITPIAKGGTGANSVGGARAALGAATGEIKNINAALSAGVWSGNFQFSFLNIFQLEVRDATTGELVEIDTRITGSPGAQAFALRADVAVAANALKAYGIGY